VKGNKDLLKKEPIKTRKEKKDGKNKIKDKQTNRQTDRQTVSQSLSQIERQKQNQIETALSFWQKKYHMKNIKNKDYGKYEKKNCKAGQGL